MPDTLTRSPRAEARDRILEQLHDIQDRHRADRDFVGAVAFDAYFDHVRDVLVAGCVVLDERETRALRWLAAGELETLATFVALILPAGATGEVAR